MLDAVAQKKVLSFIVLCTLCWGVAAYAATGVFDWRTEITSNAQGVVVKRLSASEIDPQRSHKHSFHGVVPLRRLLGTARITFHARFVYAGRDGDTISESFITWYDDCEFNPNKKCKNQWRLYYPDTRAISLARPGDELLIARMKDEELLIVVAPINTTTASWARAQFAKDTRLKTLAPPRPEAFPQVSLPQSFSQAKKILTRDIYAGDFERQTFYCGCDYSRDGKIDPVSCGYVPRRTGSSRSQRLEWEHIVPAAYIGKGRACWEEGVPECVSRNGKTFKGRKCCEKVDGQFRSIEADLNNLVPEIGELNADRRDYSYRDIPGEDRKYGACDFEVDTRLKEAEPAVPLRGFIGRTWLYMHKTHGVQLTDEDMRVYTAWAAAYPPQAWEIKRQERIQKALVKAE